MVQGATSILVMIFALGLVVLVHEWGHYFAAKRNGIIVEEFAIGMGPKLFGIVKNGTLFSLRALPLGGYCKMFGMEGAVDEEHANAAGAFVNKKVWQRITVILAGSVMNFILALFLLTAVFSMVAFTVPVVRELTPDMPGEAAGLRPGDRITRIDNRRIRTFDDVTLALAQSGGSAMTVSVLRDGQRLVKNIVPVQAAATGGGTVYRIGFAPDIRAGAFAPDMGFARYNLLETGVYSFWQTLGFMRMTLSVLTDVAALRDNVMGPIGATAVVGDVLEQGAAQGATGTDLLIWLLRFTGMISLGVGILNWLPLPAMDGGRFIFLAIEGIRRKPVPPEKENMVHVVGFMALMVLAVFIAYNDIIRIITQ